MAILVLEQTPAAQPGQTVIVRPVFNFQHFTTPHGILMLVQFVVAIILFVLNPPIWLNVISWIVWIVTHLLIWIYLFSLNERYISSPPLKVFEFYFNAGATLLYALSSLPCFFVIAWISGFFGIVNTVAYGASVFFLFPDWKAHRENLPK